MDCILRVNGENFNRDSFLKNVDWKVDTQTLDRRGKKTSFNMLITSKNTFQEQVDEVSCFLNENCENFKLLNKMGGNISIDFGVALDETEFCKNCLLDIQFMKLAIENNVTINFSVYS